MTVVEECRPIDADSRARLVLFEEAAPGVIDQHGMSLNGVMSIATGWLLKRSRNLDGILIERQRHDQRLPCVPEQSERPATSPLEKSQAMVCSSV